MLEMINIGIKNATAFRLAGKITETEVSLVLSDAREKTERYGKIVIYKEIESFEGIEISALIEEFKYLTEMGLSNLAKVAIVTDKQWVEKIVAIEDKLFKNIEIKHFTIDDKNSAIKFLKNT